MQIDSYTVLLLGTFMKVLLGAVFLMFWLRERRATWFAWCGATFLCGSLASGVFVIRGFTTDIDGIGIGVAGAIAACGCAWQGARAFERRSPLWLALGFGPLAWMAASLSPGFLDNVRYRVLLSSILIAPLLGMAAVEFWRGRREVLPSRWPVVVLFTSLALVFFSRILLVDVLPFPFGAQPVDDNWVAAFNVIIFFHALVLTVLIVAMSRERLELDQRNKAQTDPLTGALNRRAFMARGERLLARHRYDRAALCLLFLDLDHFKSLNDRFGHSGGDDVLMRVVRLVNDSIRPTDFLFRIGGEEFCCLLPHTNTEQAHRVAERIRHHIETATVDVAGSPVKATVSLGIASTETFGYDFDVLMRRADMAVYAAKRAGRNRVVVSTPDKSNKAAHGADNERALAGREGISAS